MKKITLFTMISFVFAFLLTGCIGGGADADGLREVVFKTDSGDHKFFVEVADEHEERKTGLMNRVSLDDDKGMIFIYPQEQQVAFWMKNTLIPLDMVFMTSDFEVVDYFKDVPPCEEDPCPHYIPSKHPKYIVELNAGKINEMGLERGDIAEYK